ncbi:MAG: IS1182 family transposase [Planctomycetota bacterium]
MKRFRRWEPGQAWLFPPSILDLVPAGHPAHFVRELVRGDLDLSAVYASYTSTKGKPPFHPAMMTAVLLYAYTQGIYSSRRIAKSCAERVDFMAVSGMQMPDFRTINDFRKRHLAALGGLFIQVLKVCQRAGLVQLGHVALDGSKVKANASKHKAMSYRRMREEEAKLRAEVDGWFREAEAVDDAEDVEFGKDSRGDELPAWVADKQQRLERIREAKAALEKEAEEEDDERNKPGGAPRNQRRPLEKRQRNFTDPDSRIMRTQQTYEQAYNCQIAVDAGSQVIVATSLGNRQNDARELPGMLEQIKRNTGRQARELSADTGYCSEANLKEITRRHIRGYVATGRQKHGSGSSVGQRIGPRAAEMAARLRRGGFRSRYRLRKQTVEPVFGQIKEARCFRRFHLRGLWKVAQEWLLVCTAHNLGKLIRMA